MNNKMKEFIANVRVRKVDRNGNTYHDVQLLDMNGNELGSVTKRYGYGSHYKQTVCEMLNAGSDSKEFTFSKVNDLVIFIVHNY